MAIYYAVNGAKNWSSTTDSWDLTDSSGANLASAAPTNAIDVIFDAGYTGTMTVNTNACVAKTVTANALSGGSLVLAGTNKLTVSGSFIINATSTLAFAPTSTTAGALTIANVGTLTTNVTNTPGNLLTNLAFTGTSTITLGDNLLFSALKTNQINIGTNVTLVIGSYTIKGQSVTNRVLIFANTLGTQPANAATGATINTFDNVDMRDIKLSTAGDLDLTNGQTQSIGNCGGNSATGGNLTFTTALTPNTITGNSVSLSGSVAQWDGGRVPLPQDNVVVNMTAGQTLTVDMPRIGKDISFTTATKLTLSNAVTSYGSLDFTNAGTFSGNFGWTFESQDRTNVNTLTSAGKAFPATSISINCVGSGISLQDAYSSTANIQHNNGSFIDNGNTISALGFIGDSTATRSITKTGDWTLNKTTAGNVFSFSSTTGLTWNDNAGSITITNVGATGITFAGNGRTFKPVYFYGTGAGAITFSGSNTFALLQEAVGHLGTKTLTFPSTVTTTINGSMSSGFGQGANLLTIKASTGGSAATNNYTAGGTINADYLDITDINVTPTATWYYGNNSSYHSGTGWNSGSAQISGFAPGTMSTITNRLLRHFDSNSGPIIHRTQNRLIRTR